MIFDKLLMMSNAQAITASAASTDVIDLGVAADPAVALEGLKLVMQVGTAFTAAGAGTLTVSIESSVDNSAWTTLGSSRVIGKADLTAGAILFPIGLFGIGAGVSMPRYLRAYYTVATGPMTAGTITAGFVLDRQNNRAYASGVPAVSA